MAKKGAKVYEFPLERRQKQIEEENRRVLGRATGPSSGGYVQVELTGSTVGAVAVTGPGPGERGESWWARMPPITGAWGDRRPWMKLGKVGPLAKRHRVVSVTVAAGMMWATAACGRRGVVFECFDDAMSGGDCVRCRARGYR